MASPAVSYQTMTIFEIAGVDPDEKALSFVDKAHKIIFCLIRPMEVSAR